MITAVLFDLGGVIFDSPFEALAVCELEHGLPRGSINQAIVSRGDTGVWGRNERGELTPGEFLRAFQAELDEAGLSLTVGELMVRVRSSLRLRQGMMRAVDQLRSAGFKTAVVTNNWKDADGSTSGGSLATRFDVFIESARVGMNKPDPRIFELALKRLSVPAEETVFLDDIGRNLKSAASLGMATIKVESESQALDELSGLTGVRLG